MKKKLSIETKPPDSEKHTVFQLQNASKKKSQDQPLMIRSPPSKMSRQENVPDENEIDEGDESPKIAGLNILEEQNDEKRNSVIVYKDEQVIED